MFPSYLEVEKTAIWRPKKQFTTVSSTASSYFEPDKHCCSYLEREKSGSMLFGYQKMQFTTVRSKKKIMTCI